MLLLTCCVFLWLDDLMLTLRPEIIFLELFKIIGVSVLSLLGIRILVSYARNKRITSRNTRLKLASLITISLSSYLYIGDSLKFADWLVMDEDLRDRALSKLKLAGSSPNSTKAKNLTLAEYQEISKTLHLPKVSEEATEISYEYSFDGFLPDYYFELTYQVPVNVAIDTFHYKQGDFSKYQQFKIVGDRKLVTRSELEQ